MMIRYLFNVTAILILMLFMIRADQNGNELYNEERFVLNPVELIDLVIEEGKKKHLRGVRRGYNTNNVVCYVVKEGTESTTEFNEDEKTLKSRKVWSRWDKWGQCSVTCGFGTISRQRLCVAGRCAHGEREEQHRPCTQAPCSAPLDNIPKELHDLD